MNPAEFKLMCDLMEQDMEQQEARERRWRRWRKARVIKAAFARLIRPDVVLLGLVVAAAVFDWSAWPLVERVF